MRADVAMRGGPPTASRGERNASARGEPRAQHVAAGAWLPRARGRHAVRLRASGASAWRALPLAVLILPAAAVASTWDVDPAHTMVEFSVKHMMVGTVHGRLGDVTGTVDVDEKEPTRAAIRASMKAASIDTGNPERDEHLRGPDFLDVEKYPTITFASKLIEQRADDRWKVTGDLTLHGVTREVVLDVGGPTQPVNDPAGKTRSGAHATTNFDRKDFGIVWSKLFDAGAAVVGDEIVVTIDVEVVRRSGGGR